MSGFFTLFRAKWTPAGMVVVGIILIAVSWYSAGTDRGNLVIEAAEKKTAVPFHTQPLPATVREPLIPTRTCTPVARQLQVSRPRIAAPPATASHGSSPPRSTAESHLGNSLASPQGTGIDGSHRSQYLPLRARFGIGVAAHSIEELDPLGRLGAGWYVDWGIARHPVHPKGMEFVQMIRIKDGRRPGLESVGAVIRANPGSLWLIGNEPDVRWQDNTTPEEYARVYHQFYTFLKNQDPTCRVAIGGVSQSTPLRLQYLDMILDEYEQRYMSRMPVDVWNIHAFILREEKGAWGVDVPPGMSASAGALYEVEDHDSMALFAAQIIAFRRWMWERDERDKPLIVSEYGILMPEDYGFTFERVRNFMNRSFDFLLAAADDELGYTSDGNRLVQRWAWYSLGDTLYPTGNLVELDTRELTPLGLIYRDYGR